MHLLSLLILSSFEIGEDKEEISFEEEGKPLTELSCKKASRDHAHVRLGKSGIRIWDHRGKRPGKYHYANTATWNKEKNKKKNKKKKRFGIQYLKHFYKSHGFTLGISFL